MTGNEIIISHDTMRRLHEHVEHARTKHPWPAGYPDREKYKAFEREIHEMAACMLKGDLRGAIDEALDAATVGIRIAEGDGVAPVKVTVEHKTPDWWG